MGDSYRTCNTLGNMQPKSFAICAFQCFRFAVPVHQVLSQKVIFQLVKKME